MFAGLIIAMHDAFLVRGSGPFAIRKA